MAYTKDNVNPLIVEGKIDMETLGQTLDDLKKYAYSYLFNLQKDIIGFCKLHLTYEDFDVKRDFIFTNIDLNKVMQYNVSIPFIHYNNRLRFRRSKLYNVAITNDDIEENPDLFVYSYFVFINGYLDYSARLKCREELTSVCLRKQAMTPALREEFKPGADIDILFLPDVGIESLEATKDDLVTNNLTFTTSTKIKPTDHVYAFVSSGNSLVKMYQADVIGNKVVLPEISVSEFGDDDLIKIMITILPNFHEQKVCEPGTDFFENSMSPMPIPTENILTLLKRTDGSFRLHNGIEIEKKYPDIFKLPEHSETIYSNIYYWKNTGNNHMKYEYETSLYSEFIDILERYGNGSINENIEKYKPILYDYDLTNFHKIHSKDQNIESVVYKVNKFYETFKLWDLASQLYYENLSKDTNGYIINTAKLNMQEKIRRDNHQEIHIEGHHKEFDEDRYLFIFVNKMNERPLPYKYWIDGLRYVPDEVYRDGALEYVYIPCRLFQESGSYIEIEKSNDVAWKTSFVASNNGTILDLRLGRGTIPFNSLFVYDSEFNRIAPSKYKIVVSKNGKEIGEPSQLSKLLLTENHVVKFYSTHNSVNGTKVTVAYFERPIQQEIKLDELIFSELIFNPDNVNFQRNINNIKPRANCIRVFREGRLLPQNLYTVSIPEKVNDVWKITFKGFGSFYDYQIDYIPEGYNEIYTQDDIDPKGIIDLTGIIDKPFSMKYFDVYVNGYRLLPNQVKNLSNFVIQLSGMNTLRKLYIYEKDTTVDGLYSLEIEDARKFLAEQLIEHDEEFIEKIKEKITDIIDDLNIDDIDDIDNAIEIIIYELIKCIEKGGVLPIMEISDYIFIRFRHFFESDDVFFIDPNKDYETIQKKDMIYYIAPRRGEEIVEINNFLYVRQFNKLLEAIRNNTYINEYVDTYIDANEERESLKDKYGSYKELEKQHPDDALFIAGNLFSARHPDFQKFLGPET